jgi:hypothetical protein
MTNQRQSLPPQPLPDPASKPYWERAALGVLALPCCRTCGTWHIQPIEFCRSCGGALAYRDVSGEGTVYSFLIQHHAVAPGFDGVLPYVIALVNPDEAPDLRMLTRLVGVDPADVHIGQKVKVAFLDHPGGAYKLPVFTLNKSSAPVTL